MLPGPDEPFVYSHPKLEKLEEVVLQHFRLWAESSADKKGDLLFMAAWVIYDSPMQPVFQFKERNLLIRCVQTAARRERRVHLFICRFSNDVEIMRNLRYQYVVSIIRVDSLSVNSPQIRKVYLLTFSLSFAPISIRSVMIFFARLIRWSLLTKTI